MSTPFPSASVSTVGWCFVNESYAAIECWHRRIGEYIRFWNGFYFFTGNTFLRFDTFEALDEYVRDLVRRADRSAS